MFFLIGLKDSYIQTQYDAPSSQYSDELGIIPFPVFWFMLGTIYYSHKICFDYKIWRHLFNFLKGAVTI